VQFTVIHLATDHEDADNIGERLAKKKLWGGRFLSDQDPLFADFNDSLRFDRELLEVDIQGSLAYARGLERAGVFTREERRQVEQG